MTTRAFALAYTVLRLLCGFTGERNPLAVDGIRLDPSMSARLNADVSAHDMLDGPYRPADLLPYLAGHTAFEAQRSDAARRAVAGG